LKSCELYCAKNGGPHWSHLRKLHDDGEICLFIGFQKCIRRPYPVEMGHPPCTRRPTGPSRMEFNNRGAWPGETTGACTGSAAKKKNPKPLNVGICTYSGKELTRSLYPFIVLVLPSLDSGLLLRCRKVMTLHQPPAPPMRNQSLGESIYGSIRISMHASGLDP